jgi:NADPH:quinone reductase-like Zn-dependent oxidoreductase
MRAIVADRPGGTEVLSFANVPVPTPGPGEVLIRVSAAGLNPVDIQFRSSAEVAQALLGYDPFPWIPGWDVAGTVEAIGFGVARFQPGDRVFGTVNFPKPGSAYAEFAVAHVSHLAVTPHDVSDVEAAALSLVGLTAWQGLIDAGRLQTGERVVVTAAAGGVGHIAIQIARQAGAHVIAVGSPANLDYLLTLGADEVVDRTAGPLDEAIEPVDLAFTPLAGETQTQAIRALKPGGRLVSLVMPILPATPAGISATLVLVSPDSGELAEVARLADSGRVRVTIAQTLPLEHAARAHELSATGNVRGKVVLSVAP